MGMESKKQRREDRDHHGRKRHVLHEVGLRRLNIAYMNALKILEKLYSLINLYMIEIDDNMIRKLYSYQNK
ncbi:hypothetical protein SB776_41950, partial [Burkholderia sp. SIMBA_045]